MRPLVVLLLMVSVAGSYYRRIVHVGEYFARSEIVVVARVVEAPKYRGDVYPVVVEEVLQGDAKRGQRLKVQATSDSPPGPAMADERNATRLLLLLTRTGTVRSYDLSHPDRKIYVDNHGRVMPTGMVAAMKEFIRIGFGKSVDAWVAALRSRNHIVRWDVLGLSDSQRGYMPKKLRAACNDVRVTRQLLAMLGDTNAYVRERVRKTVCNRVFYGYEAQAARLFAEHLVKLEAEDSASELIAYLRKHEVSAAAITALELIDTHPALAQRCLVKHRWVYDELNKRLKTHPTQTRKALAYLDHRRVAESQR